MNGFQPYVEHVIASETVDLAMLIDINLCTTTFICLLTHILTNPGHDPTAGKLLLYVKISGTDVIVNIKDSPQRDRSAAAASLPAMSASMLSIDDGPPALQESEWSLEQTRLYVCRQCISHMGWQLRCGVDTDKSDETLLYSIVIPDAVCTKLNTDHMEAVNEKQASSLSNDNESAKVLQPWVKVAVLDDCPFARFLLTTVFRKLQAGLILVCGETQAEVLDFSALVMREGVHIVILDHLLSQALSTPEESEAVNGISIMQELRSMGFKGMIIMRSGDAEDEKLQRYVQAGFDAVIGKDADCAERICAEWYKCSNKRAMVP